jgi:hypothetical protein
MTETHFFNARLAREVGIEGAVILHNLAYLQLQHEYAGNVAMESDGRWYVRHSYGSLAQWHSYLSEQQIRRLMRTLEEGGYVVKSHLGKPFDRTLYWSVSREIIDMSESTDRHVGIDRSDVSKSTDVQQTYNSKQKPSDGDSVLEQFERFWSTYSRKEGKKDALALFRKLKPEERDACLADNVKRRFGDREKKYIPAGNQYIKRQLWQDEYPDGSDRSREVWA